MTTTPMKDMFQTALKDFRKALVDRRVYDDGHENLDRACRGADDFVRFLIEGPNALAPRRPRK
jgi:hypothetical protein